MAKAPRSLVGKTVAITGGARGIGRATAAALIAQGARVAIGDLEGPLAESTAQELGAGTLGLPLDVTNHESFTAFVDEVESRIGPLDILVNNAGIMPVGPFLEESDALAKRMIDINVHGVIFGSKLALERFSRRGRGHLVNIASIAGKGAAPHLATYCASKFAVVGLTEALRLAFADTGIDFTVVMPVGVNTELYSGIQPMRGIRTPEPEDVAAAIVEALQTARYEVYVPRRMNALLRMSALLPRRAVDAIGKTMGTGEMLTKPDHRARAAYEARIEQTIAAARPSDPEPAPAAAADAGAAPTERADEGAEPVAAEQPEREAETV